MPVSAIIDDRKQQLYRRGGFQLCQFIAKRMARTHGIGARIVYIGRQRVIKKRKENLRRASFVVSVLQKRKKGIVKSNRETRTGAVL
jgi:hypothetical protein